MKLISANYVIRKVIADLALGDQDIPTQDMIEWMGEGLRYLGVTNFTQKKQCTIKIEEFFGELPEDLFIIFSIRDQKSAIPYVQYKPGSDRSWTKRDGIRLSNKTFEIIGSTIRSIYQSGELEITYAGIPTDEDGFPMIPDNQNVIDALFWRIAYGLSLRGHEFKQKALTFERCELMWRRYLGQAYVSSNQMTEEQMERYKNLIYRLKPVLDGYRTRNSEQFIPERRITDSDQRNFRRF